MGMKDFDPQRSKCRNPSAVPRAKNPLINQGAKYYLDSCGNKNHNP